MEDVRKAKKEPQAAPPHFEPSQTAPPFEKHASSGAHEAMAWVQENQRLAVLGAFGVGVFIGVMMRH